MLRLSFDPYATDELLSSDSSRRSSTTSSRRGSFIETSALLSHSDVIAAPPVTLRVKALFGIGEFGLAIVTIVWGFFLNTFLLEVAEVSPYAAGLILLIAQLFDALTDPLLGRFSDKTTSRFGRRRPWLIFGAVPGALFYIALWQVPGNPGNDYLPFYYGFMTIAVTLSHTAVSVPYAALTTELSDDYDERTSLTMWRVGAGVVGGSVAVALHSVIVESVWNSYSNVVDYQAGYTLSAVALGFVVGVAPLITGITVKERYSKIATRHETTSSRSYWKQLKSTFALKSFSIAASIYTLCWLSIANVQNNLFLWCKYVLKQESHFTYMIVTIQLTAAGSLAAWSSLSLRLGKKVALMIATFFLTVILSMAYFLDDKTHIGYMYAMGVAAGFGLGGAMLLPWSMLPDIVDEDELRCGQRREGDFYGLFVMLQKVGLGLALGGSSLALGGAGYESPDQQFDSGHEYQNEQVLFVLSLLAGPFPAILMLLSLILTYFYPLSRQRHVVIRTQLLARDVAAASQSEELM